MTTPTDPLVTMAASLEPKRAISYIRVSTHGQASRGDAAEGFSIPAQREANKRKASQLGALIIKEFIDRGESARSAKRPELQNMLGYIKEHPEVDYVIVHKLDRLARNRVDDVDINRVFDECNVRLISTSENIDQTPGSMLLHGIMSAIAEFYSRNLGHEVTKGMSQKAKNGGTNGRATLGYVNKRGKNGDGKDTAWVEIDPERGPHITEAFRLYATGDWTVAKLAAHLEAAGLTSRATSRHPSRPLGKNQLLGILRNPYYRGVVVYQGAEYPGKHPALIDTETWLLVQSVLTSHYHGERNRTHNHHLKTTVRCGLCGNRLTIQNSTNRHDTTYAYFVCRYRSRHQPKCGFHAVLIDAVDEQVAGIYKTIRITTGQRQHIEKHLLAELDRIYAQQAAASKNLTNQRERLKAEQAKLLQAHYADAIPLELMKQEQQRITRQICTIDKEIAGYTANRQQVEDHLAQALDLLEDCHKLYQHAPAHLKKMLNNVFFEQVLINPPEANGLDGAGGTGQMIANDRELVASDGWAALHDGELVGVSTGEQFGNSIESARSEKAYSHLNSQADSSSVQAVPHINPPFDVLGNPVLQAEIFNSGQNADLATGTDRTQPDNKYPEQAQNLELSLQAASTNLNNLLQTPDTTKQKSPPEKHHSDEGLDMRIMVGPVGFEPTTCGLKVRSSTN